MAEAAPTAPAPEAVALAAGLMDGFARRTGLDPGGPPPRRYLWTDAFAVCNLLALHQLTGEAVHRERALRLVDQVHEVLGRHRDDDPRQGWISGLEEEEGRRRPTAGGLRIGKELPERGAREPLDPRREWDRDGQYFHYLTRWMHALAQAGAATGEPRFQAWAVELAVVAQERFTLRGEGPPRLAWKMSIALSRPLVPTMGQHDALDGWITALSLLAREPQAEGEGETARLRRAAAALEEIAARTRWASEDPLGLGGLLADAWRVAQLLEAGVLDDPGLLALLLDEARRSFASFSGESLRLPAAQRLAFRELGLAIGLEALQRLSGRLGAAADAAPELRARLAALARWLPLAGEIVGLWREPRRWAAAAWEEHRDIDDVMLATALVPSGYLDLAGLPRPA